MIAREVAGLAKREFLPALRRRLRETKGLPERVRASTSGYVVPGIPYRHGWDAKRAVEEGFEANPLVFRAVDVICANAIDQRIVLRRDDPDDGEMISAIGDDPTRLLYIFNLRANPLETGKIFRHRLIAQFLLSKRGVFIEVIRTRGGRIGMLNLLDPDLVNIVPSEDDPINAFEVMTSNSSVRSVNYLPRFDPRASVEAQPAAVLWIRSPHPLVMWQGASPMQAAGLSIDLDRYARLYNRRFLQNDGRPGGLLSVKGVVNRDTMELIQSQFTGGPESAGRTTVIQADAVSYADTSGTPRDMMWGDLSQATKEEIAMVFGVPRSVLGDASGQTFDNADADYAQFWEHRMKTLLGLLDDQLDILTGGYDDDLFLRHDLSRVWVLGRHKREEADRAAADLERGAITYDEYREITGRKPLDVAATRVLWLPVAGKMAVADSQHDADGQDAADNPMAGMPAMLPPGGDPAVEGQAAGAGAPVGLPDGTNANLRLLAPGRHAPGSGQPSELTTMEGKQGGPRPGGSGNGAEPAASWR